MRKIKTLLTVILVLAITIVSQAQTKLTSIRGRMEDKTRTPLVGASVSLLRAKDSSLVKLMATQKTGEFIFSNMAEGQYLVSVSAIGFGTYYSKVFQATGEYDLGVMAMETRSQELKGAVVTARKQLVEQKIDRMVVNVEAAVSNVGATAMEVLEKSPGVSVDKDGNISLKGKEGVQVYVDGRPTYLSGTDLANLLRSMNANQLDLIEIMTNPPAKYDAAGNSGIINIKTKKTKQVGYNGSISLGYGQGKYPKLNESANFNYRKDKINLFANIGYNKRDNFNDLSIQRKFIDANTKQTVSHFEQTSHMRDKGESFNGKIGLDFFATKKSTFGIVVGGFSNPNSFSNTSDVYISDAARILQGITQAKTSNDRSWKNYSTNLNFRHVFDSTGKELTIDADLVGYRSKNDQILVNAYYDPTWHPAATADTLLGYLPQNINIYTAKADYVHPLKKGAKIEAGLKTAFVNTDNNALYDSLQNGTKVPDIGRSNHFKYQENVNAAYVNYSRPFGKTITAQLGLRFEHTHSKGRQITTGETFDRNYAQLFPTLFLQYTMDKNNTLGLNYGRRIQRPDYEDLNPFILFLDKYTAEQGNPNLQPQFSHNVELSHTFKGFLTTTANYTKTTDIITQVLEQNPNTNETFVRSANIATLRQYGLSVAAGFPLSKWWNANLYANVYNNLYKGVVNGDYTELGATTALFNLSNQIRISKKTSAELSGFYRTKGVDGVFTIHGFGAINAGISQQVMKGKGSVRLSVRDVFYTQKIKGESRFSNIDAAFQQSRDTRVVTINFTYRFSKGKAAGQSKRSSASDEQSRVKVDAGN